MIFFFTLGPGGRVTDYRIPDFGVIMKSNRLAPYYGQVKDNEQQPLEKMKERLARFTKFVSSFGCMHMCGLKK